MQHDLHVGMGQEECPESLGEEELPAPNKGPMHRVADTNLRDRNDKIYAKWPQKRTRIFENIGGVDYRAAH